MDKKTVDLCSLVAEGDCEGPVCWGLESTETGKKLRVCDQHLPNAIRTLGTPALVDMFEQS